MWKLFMFVIFVQICKFRSTVPRGSPRLTNLPRESHIICDEFSKFFFVKGLARFLCLRRTKLDLGLLQ